MAKFKAAYEALRSPVSPSEFLKSHGTSGLTEREYAIARVCALVLEVQPGITRVKINGALSCVTHLQPKSGVFLKLLPKSTPSNAIARVQWDGRKYPVTISCLFLDLE